MTLVANIFDIILLFTPFLAATAAQEAHLSVRKYVTKLCFQCYFAVLTCNVTCNVAFNVACNVACNVTCNVHSAMCIVQCA